MSFSSSEGSLLRYLFATLCVLILAWVFILPASWLSGTIKDYRVRVLEKMSEDTPVPSDTLTKYEDYPFIRFSHILASGFWAACALMQLAGPGKTPRRKAIHRLAGRVLVICSAFVLMGYMAIDYYGLSTSKEAGMLGLRMIAAWFGITAACTAISAMEVARLYRSGKASPTALFVKARRVHMTWAMRHLSSGAWVILMRGMLMLTGALIKTGFLENFRDEDAKRQYFGDIGAIAWAIAVGGLELYISLGASRLPYISTLQVKGHL